MKSIHKYFHVLHFRVEDYCRRQNFVDYESVNDVKYKYYNEIKFLLRNNNDVM